jgi:membrane protein YdbS with pleckstrin-like domain
MTNSPEATTPDSSPAFTTTDAADPDGVTAPATPESAVDAASEPGPAPGVEHQPAPAPADGTTFPRLAESRSENRLVLAGGVWHQISPKYVWVQLISTGSFLILVMAATLVLTLAFHQMWAWIPGGILTVILVWTLAILPRQARAIGYQLREDDLVFRRGILWQRFVAVPYGRMQLVDITHGPLDRGFGIAQLKFVTAAAATGVVIPGLDQGTAETLRDHLVAVAESRRTGL